MASFEVTGFLRAKKKISGGICIWVSEYNGAYKDKKEGGIVPARFATWEIWFPRFYVTYVERYFRKGWYINVKGQLRTMALDKDMAADLHYKSYIAIGQVINVAPNILQSSWRKLVADACPKDKREKESQENGEPVLSIDDIPDISKTVIDDFDLSHVE